MRFLHTADWHIGKQLYGYSLEKEQIYAFDKLIEIAKSEDIDAIVVAGDIYNQGMASERSFKLFNKIMYKLNIDLGYPLLAISGNHDSADRLGVGKEWFVSHKFYLSTSLDQVFNPICIKDTQFFLLPFFSLHDAKVYFNDYSLNSLNEAYKKIFLKLYQLFDPKLYHVLVAHLFTSDKNIKNEEIGNLSLIPIKLFDIFDYVALGHIHNHKVMSSNLKVKYSGSLLKFNVSEANQTKGVYIVDTKQKNFKFVPITPLNDIYVLKGMFNNLYENPNQLPNDSFVDFELTDSMPIEDLMNKLRNKYCHQRIIRVNRINGIKNLSQINVNLNSIVQSPFSLVSNFFNDVTEKPMNDIQKGIIKQYFDKNNK